MVIPDLERPFFAAAVSGIQQVATEVGYRVMICQSKESYTTEVSNVQALVASQVDGLLICHSRETENFDHVLPEACRGIPGVHFDRVDESLSSARVMIDDRGGAFAVTEHLLLEGSRTRARGFDCQFSRAGRYAPLGSIGMMLPSGRRFSSVTFTLRSQVLLLSWVSW